MEGRTDKMKKFLIMLLVVCLAFAAAAGYLLGRKVVAEDAQPSPSASPAGEESQEATGEPIEAETLDYEAIYALHDPEDIVMLVDGEEINWGEYFSWLYMSAMQTEQYFVAMASYGMPMSWSDPVGEDPAETYAAAALEGGENTLIQIMAIQGFADSKGIVPSQETLDSIDEQVKSDMAATVGEEGTEEDFQEYLDSLYRSRDAYDRTIMANYINVQNFTESYGLKGEKVSDEQALGYLEENGYVCANHILLATVDLSTGEALDEETVAEKKALAESLAEELKAIEEPDKLVERFKELKEEYCEDTGKTAFPDGYLFRSGEMVEEFENAAMLLEEYGVSEPVESPYGYHIILRLPLDADALMGYSSTGEALNAREYYANYNYALELDAYLEAMEAEYAPDFTPPELGDYLE